jgi:hydrogenase maturation protease
LNTANAIAATYLILGYGNTLRSDDGAGYHIAAVVESWNLAQVRSLAVHQLTPDLADAIAQSEIVIFVDAATTVAELAIESLPAHAAESFTGHYANPSSLLRLAETLYHHSPNAYRILIPAVDFEFGEAFSAVTQTAVTLALTKLKQWLSSPASPGEYYEWERSITASCSH